jgi:hypothetical protein
VLAQLRKDLHRRHIFPRNSSTDVVLFDRERQMPGRRKGESCTPQADPELALCRREKVSMTAR